MSRVFHGAPVQFGGAIDMSGGVSMQVGGRNIGGAGVKANLAVQTANIQAQRPLQPFYDLFSNNIYYVVGRVQAQCSMDRLLGPSGSMAELYRQLSDPCRIAENAVLLRFMGKFCESGSLANTRAGAVDVLAGGNSYTLNNAAMSSVQLQLRAQDFVFMEQFSFNATDLIGSR
jgi:hypothetical protein